MKRVSRKYLFIAIVLLVLVFLIKKQYVEHLDPAVSSGPPKKIDEQSFLNFIATHPENNSQTVVKNDKTRPAKPLVRKNQPSPAPKPQRRKSPETCLLPNQIVITPGSRGSDVLRILEKECTYST